MRSLTSEIAQAAFGDSGQDNSARREHGNEGSGCDAEGDDGREEASAGCSLGRQTGEERTRSTEAGDDESEPVHGLRQSPMILGGDDPKPVDGLGQ